MIRRTRGSSIALAVAMLLASTVVALAKKPKLPPDHDPGGQAIILLTTGIDYTKPELAARLARDGEGDLIGWDTIDGDNRPYVTNGEGTAQAIALGKAPGTRIVVIRIDPGKAPSLMTGLQFVGRMPGRVIVMPELAGDVTLRTPLFTAFGQLADHTFIVPAGPVDDLNKSLAIVLPENVLTVAPKTSPPDVTAYAYSRGQLLVDATSPSNAVAEFLPALFACSSAEIAQLSLLKPSLRRLTDALPKPNSKSIPTTPAACRISVAPHQLAPIQSPE